MSQDVESIYNQYISNLKQAMPNVDPNLAHRIMYMERKIADEMVSEPHVNAIIEYKSGVDLDKKINGLREKYSLEVEHADKQNSLHIMSNMKINKVREISLDRDIVKISGKSDPAMSE
ncbi:MAG: hypothetical protein KGH87_01570 [Thaumarchaeota archaeon]|nr:hypothetical protein [Nitrososphaerota archaeon]MDE1838586.1 hypothetical protein [Nitrososphaerota archaeon]